MPDELLNIDELVEACEILTPEEFKLLHPEIQFPIAVASMNCNVSFAIGATAGDIYCICWHDSGMNLTFPEKGSWWAHELFWWDGRTWHSIEFWQNDDDEPV